jgi:hypothetical protein
LSEEVSLLVNAEGSDEATTAAEGNDVSNKKEFKITLDTPVTEGEGV